MKVKIEFLFKILTKCMVSFCLVSLHWSSHLWQIEMWAYKFYGDYGFRSKSKLEGLSLGL